MKFERQKYITVTNCGKHTVEVSAEMKDKFHHIRISLIVNSDLKSIIKAEAEMETAPFDLCRETCEKMRGLEGVRIKKGVNRLVREVVGTSRGCTHLVDLVMDALKAVTQFTEFCEFPEGLSFDEKLQKIQAVNMGTCHTYSNLDRNPKYIGNKDI